MSSLLDQAGLTIIRNRLHIQLEVSRCAARQCLGDISMKISTGLYRAAIVLAGLGSTGSPAFENSEYVTASEFITST